MESLEVPNSDDPWPELIKAGEVIPGFDQRLVRLHRPRKYDFSGSTALEGLRSSDR